MTAELFDELEGRVVSLLHALSELQLENGRLKQENTRLTDEREAFRSRIDSILSRLEGV